MSLVPKPRGILRKVVVATAGDLGKPGFDDDGVQRYVKAGGGRFSADLDESVTHLLVSKRETKAQKSRRRVREGQKRRKLEIVTVNWLEDSINKRKKQPTKPYSLVRMRKETKAAEKRELDKNKNIEKARYFMNPDKYRVYTDSTFFRYEVLLTKDRDDGRFMLTLFESVAEPRLYHAALKYWHSAARGGDGKPTATRRPPPRKTTEQLVHATPGPFEREFAAFAKFFRQKTGVPWDRRLAAFAKGKATAVPGRYVYDPPAGGKPVGLVAGRNPLDDAGDEGDGSDAGPGGNGDDDVGETIRAVLVPAFAAAARADDAMAACAAALAARAGERRAGSDAADAPARETKENKTPAGARRRRTGGTDFPPWPTAGRRSRVAY